MGPRSKTELEVRAEKVSASILMALPFSRVRIATARPLKLCSGSKVSLPTGLAPRCLSLARHLVQVARKQAPVLCKKLPNTPVVVYRGDMIEPRR